MYFLVALLSLFCFFNFIQFSGYSFFPQDFSESRRRACPGPYGPVYAPLAQLVEHLTLNQGVPGSSP